MKRQLAALALGAFLFTVPAQAAHSRRSRSRSSPLRQDISKYSTGNTHCRAP